METYRCDNCEHEADRDEMEPLSGSPFNRFEVGTQFTDRECPECGGCAYPAETGSEKGDLGALQRLAGGLADDIDSFDRRCNEGEGTDMGEAWDLLYAIRDSLRGAVKPESGEGNAVREAWVKDAKEHWECDDIEIDDDARVSQGAGGAFVQAWVWVSDEEGT